MTAESTGRLFIEAVAAKDHTGVRELLDPHVEFRAMTPRRFWEGSTPDDVETALAQWFDDGDEILGLDDIATDAFLDVEHVSYRLRVRSEGRIHLVGQQAYLTLRDGRIAWLRIMCAGYRPLPSA